MRGVAYTNDKGVLVLHQTTHSGPESLIQSDDDEAEEENLLPQYRERERERIRDRYYREYHT